MARTNADAKILALQAVTIFAGCSKRELRQVARLCVSVPVPDGSVLTAEGDPGTECFVVASGKAEVSISGRAVGTIGPGECIGEIALLDRGPRTATVTALTPMSLYVLSAGEFQALLKISPDIARKIAVSLARRLRLVETDRAH